MTLEELMTGLRGYGQGVTAGLIQYPQAALSSVVTDMPFKESLASLREENARLAAANPKSWMGGNIVGGGLAAVGSGGAGLGALMGRGAILGGVGGYTQNEDLGDAATGAALGAGFGAAAKGVDVARNKFVRSQLKRHLKEITARADEKLVNLVSQRMQFTTALDQTKNALKNATTKGEQFVALSQLRQIEEALAKVNQAIGGARGNISQSAAKTTAMADDVEMLKLAGGKKLTAPGALLRGAISDVARQGATGGALGAAIGGGGAYAAGASPEAIITSALGGAGLGASTLKAKAGLAAKVLPAAAPETIARAATMAVNARLPQEPERMPWEETLEGQTPEVAPVEMPASSAAGKKAAKELMPWEQ